MALVHRALVNGWSIAPHILEQLYAKISDAVSQYTVGEMTDVRARHVIGLVRLVAVIEARERIADGYPKSWFPNIRRRGPEKRRKAGREAFEAQQEEMVRLMARLGQRARQVTT